MKRERVRAARAPPTLKGRSTPVTPGTGIELEVPDMYGRPWARIWEQYWKDVMERPQEEDVFSFE